MDDGMIGADVSVVGTHVWHIIKDLLHNCRVIQGSHYIDEDSHSYMCKQTGMIYFESFCDKLCDRFWRKKYEIWSAITSFVTLKRCNQRNQLQWCHMTIRASPITGIWAVYSTDCSNQQQRNIKRSHYWPVMQKPFPCYDVIIENGLLSVMKFHGILSTKYSRKFIKLKTYV